VSNDTIREVAGADVEETGLVELGQT